MRTLNYAFLIGGILLAACSKEKPGAGDADSVAAAADQDEPMPETGPVNSSIHLVVTGGEHAGTYDAQATDGGCSANLTGPNNWGNQYSIDTSDPRAFSSLQMIVPDAKAAAGGSPHFLITVSFGPLLGLSSYTVDTRPEARGAAGSGQVTVEDRGNTGTVKFSAVTGDGIKLDGTIDCRSVVRGG